MALSPALASTFGVRDQGATPPPAPPEELGWPRRVFDAKAAIEKRIASWIRNEEWERQRMVCEPIWKDFNRWRRLYRGTIMRKTLEGLADVNIPITLENVEVLTAQIVGSIFSSERFVRAIPGEGATLRTAHAAEALLHAHLTRDHFDDKFRRFLSSWVILVGTGILKRCWKFDRRHVMRRVRDEITGATTLRPVLRSVADHASVEIVDLCNFVPSHLEAEEIEDLDWLIQRHVVDKRWLREKAMETGDNGIWRGGTYINIDQIPEGDFTDQPLVEPLARTPRRSGYGGTAAPSAQIGGARQTKIELLERWGPPLWEEWAPEFFDPVNGPALQRAILQSWGIDTDDGWLQHAADWVIEVAGKSGTVVRIDVNRDPDNKLPFNKVEWIPLVNEFFALGVAEISESLHLEANAKANMALDERTKALSSMKAIDMGGLDHGRLGQAWSTNLEWRPNGIVWCRRDPRTVIFDLQPAHVHSVGDEAVDSSRAQARRSTGAVDTLQGEATSDVTATAEQLASTAALTRIGMHLKYIDRRLARELFPSLYSMIRAYSTRKSILTLLGEMGLHEPRLIEPEDLIGEIYFQLAGGDAQQRDAVYRQQLVGFLQTLGSTPALMIMLQQNPSIAASIARECALAFGIRNAERLIPDPIEEIANESDQEDENTVLMAGMDAQVKVTDAHEVHVPICAEGLMMARQMQAPESVIEAFERHLRTHVRLLRFLREQGNAAPGGNGSRSQTPNASAADEARSANQRGQLNPSASRRRRPPSPGQQPSRERT